MATPQPGGPGVPQEPVPGVPNEPPPGQPLGDGGPQITLSGTVSLAGWSGAPIRVDVFDGVARLTEPGAWSVSVSSSGGQLWVDGYADDNQDGKPDHSEPVGWYGGNPVAGGAAQTGIDLTLTVQPPE
ncbi:MAG: hypothetical protein ACI8RZ_003448 [Myxococcota bacterium]|jgi:hypothetical protein